MDDFIFLSEYLKEKFNGKIAKVCIDGGFSCPNREGGLPGCLFCTDEGAGEFAGKRSEPISMQISKGRKTMDRKWKNSGYIAYFQNFTNTYGDIGDLRDKYEEAVSCEDVIGLAIATRPDCLGEDVLDLLEEYNNKTFLWIELGLQTSSAKTAELINRGYENDMFVGSVHELKKRNIKFVVHTIAGLPGESKEDFLNTIELVNSFKSWGIKFHSIYVQNNSPLAEFSKNTGFEPLEMYEYIDWVTDAMMILRKDIVIHRLTGDPDKRLLSKPLWQGDKLRVLSEIRRIYKEKSNNKV